MKRILLIISCFILFSNICTAQIFSMKYTLSPTFPNVNEERTRVLKFLQYKSLVFLDTLDTTYICHVSDYYLSPTPNTFIFHKKRLPLGLVISDMERIGSTPWYSGSSYNEGVYGRISLSSNYSLNHSVHVFNVPVVNNLRKFTVASNMNDPLHQRMFAIGETYASGHTRSHIMELDLQGTGITGFEPFPYAQMSDSEYVDDVTLVGDWVIFTTQDSRSTLSKVNLRMSNIEQMLSGVEIDDQWSFMLEPYEDVIGKVFITHFSDSDFGVCYIKLDWLKSKYILCVHTINRHDLLNNINSVISQEIVLPKGEIIQDITYDEVEKVLIVLLDKDYTQSVFLHVIPYKASPYNATYVVSDVNVLSFTGHTKPGEGIKDSSRLFPPMGRFREAVTQVPNGE